MSPKFSKGPKSPRSKHRWTVFVRIANQQHNNHIHKLISKVRFGLNSSFGTDYEDIVADDGKKDKNKKDK